MTTDICQLFRMQKSVPERGYADNALGQDTRATPPPPFTNWPGPPSLDLLPFIALLTFLRRMFITGSGTVLMLHFNTGDTTTICKLSFLLRYRTGCQSLPPIDTLAGWKRNRTRSEFNKGSNQYPMCCSIALSSCGVATAETPPGTWISIVAVFYGCRATPWSYSRAGIEIIYWLGTGLY